MFWYGYMITSRCICMNQLPMLFRVLSLAREQTKDPLHVEIVKCLMYFYSVTSVPCCTYLISILSLRISRRLQLTHWGRDKMDAIFQTTFSNGYSWMKIYEFRMKFHWSLFLRFQLTIFQHWFRWWLDADQATSHYLNQWWIVCWRIYASLGLNELTHLPLVQHICVHE